MVKALLDAALEADPIGQSVLSRAVGETDVGGLTPLHCASMEGRGEAAALLLIRGASSSAKDARGRSPLEVACNKELLKLLTNPRPPNVPPCVATPRPPRTAALQSLF